MSLSNAAVLADDATPGGFQSRALAALINQAQQVVAAGPPAFPGTEYVYAQRVLSRSTEYRAIAAWAVVGDPAVNATLTPTDGQILAAVAARWPFLVALA